MANYFVVDIETVPVATGNYFEAPESERKEYLNPIDSRVIAAGIRSNGSNEIFMGEEEDEVLTEFWEEWSAVRQGDPNIKVVGFNICEFDMPILTSRSFQNEIPVTPFVIKDLIDLRERISAFKWRPKGTLQDYAEAVGIPLSTGGGENVPYWYRDGDLDMIKEHLEEDLEVTDELFQKAKQLNISKIDKW